MKLWRRLLMLSLATIAISSLCRDALAATYEVGPGKPYARIIDCPTYDLKAGDTIRVYYRSEPYREKFLLHGVGTAASPVVLMGVADSLGRKPVIDGQNAVSSLARQYWNENRQLILVGQNSPLLSNHVVIDGFVLRNANRHYTFTDDQGNTVAYGTNACGVRVEYGNVITIRNCEILNNENGIQTSAGNPLDVLLESCYIHDNGSGSSTSYLEHNVYLGGGGTGDKVTIQFCRFGELQNDGQQCKFRVGTVVFRYNWVDGGRNSQLDLVESPERTGPVSHYVYGNVIIKPAHTHNGRMVHFGGDQSGSNPYGTLRFFNNTCVIRNTSTSTRLFQISRDGCNVVADNNIFHADTGQAVRVLDGENNLAGSHNWLSSTITGTAVLAGSILGLSPGFRNLAADDFELADRAQVRDVVRGYVPPPGYPLAWQYKKHLGWKARLNDWVLDLGAFEGEVIDDGSWLPLMIQKKKGLP